MSFLGKLLGAPTPDATAPSDAVGERPALPPDLTRKVRRIEIATKRLVNQGLAGEYHSAFKGRGVEFSEVRPYQPGDDVRSIDWNVTARTGEPHVKTFVEERDLTVFVAVDVSGSLSFGSRSIVKRDLAAEVAALLAFAAVRNGDKVGGALLSEGMDLYLPPERRRTHVLRIVREILVRPASGGTDLDSGLAQIVSTLRRRSVLFVLSDFLDARLGRAFEHAAARHDVIAIEVVDPRDQELPDTGPVLLRDAETGRAAVVSGRRLGQRHARRRQEERHHLNRRLARLGVDHLVLSTDRPYLGPLVAFFEARRRRLGR